MYVVLCALIISFVLKYCLPGKNVLLFQCTLYADIEDTITRGLPPLKDFVILSITKPSPLKTNCLVPLFQKDNK